MSVNTAHANNGVLIHAGEYILLHSDKCSMDFSGQDSSLFKGQKHGRIYLTSHRMIFNSKNQVDPLQSFSFPFILLSDVTLEQPVFGANLIKGKIRAQPNGNFVGEVKFKLSFKAGGAIEFGQAMLRAAGTAQRNFNCSDDPPPYSPSGAWHEAPPPAYQPPPGYYGWLPSHDAFTGVPSNTVFMSDNPPPYPGIGGLPPQGQPPQGQPPQNSGYGSQQNSGYGPQQNSGYGSPPNSGYCAPPNSAYGPPPNSGYGAPPSYPGMAPQAGYSHPGSYQGFAPPNYGVAQPQQNYGWGQPAAAPGGGFGYPAASSAPYANGFPGSAPPYVPDGGQPNASSTLQNSKEAEAAQSAYNNFPNQPTSGYAPPQGYNEAPPSYNSLPERRNP